MARYYYEESDQEFWDMEDFPNVAPPFERFWLDFQAPERIVSREYGVTPWTHENPSAWGFLCFGTQLTTENAAAFLGDPIWSHYGEHFGAYIAHAKWGIDLYLDWRVKGKFVGPTWLWRGLVDDSGALVKSPAGAFVLSALMIDQGTRESVDVMAEMLGSREEARQAAYNIVLPFFHTAMLSLTFLHCRNVSLDQVNPPMKRVRNNSQKRRGERDYQPVPYKILNIQPMKTLLREEGKSDVVGTKRSLHICRGHFAHYQEGRGLFGKYPGTFWRPMHVRGSTTRGVTAKDYHITL